MQQYKTGVKKIGYCDQSCIVETKPFETKTETAKFFRDQDQDRDHFFETLDSRPRPALVKTKTEEKCRKNKTAGI